ncbi:MAG: domain / Band 7 family protein [Gemmataceae bacterium]|nr:domain / Band 7 family protein [Gemmataceae bacterium]
MFALFAAGELPHLVHDYWLVAVAAAVLLVPLAVWWLAVRAIPNNKVGVVEKLWSAKGSVSDGRIIALNGEAGYQADLLRGGLHFGYWRWQYRVHVVPLVTVPQGQIGYVYARDGNPLPPSQTLGRVVECTNFQDARTFLTRAGEEAEYGQRGRQRAILREGVYAINPVAFVVMTENRAYSLLHLLDAQESNAVKTWHEQLTKCGGFHPVVIGGSSGAGETEVHDDLIGVVTIHDGPSLPPGEIIAPAVGTEPDGASYHNNYQDPEAFLAAAGRRGRQYAPLTDGTYFINRWFASVELVAKTVVPIGHVGVVVSYVGRAGRDVSGTSFRHGERVQEGERGVWERPLGPGKYPFNVYAGQVIQVPTTNFVLHWITGKTEAHKFDEGLRSIDLVTRDAYEPLLPLSVVVHIDYQRAPSVIQRFGDVKKLITQTIDPMLSAYFRDIAHKKTMLQLLHERDLIQAEARAELRDRFRGFDIECVDVLIGKPVAQEKDTKIETLLEQLRLRQLSIEQLETYERQRAAAEKQKTLNEAQAQAAVQVQLTNAKAEVQIAESRGEAELARARKQAEQTVVTAEAELARARRQAEQTVVTAEAHAKEKVLAGRGEGQKALQIGLSEAAVVMRKVAAYGDPRLYAAAVLADRLANSAQPLVPQRMFVSGANGDTGSVAGGPLGLLLTLMLGEKTGLGSFADSPETAEFKAECEKLARDAIGALGGK